jgi:hypothetical protein
MSHTPVPRHSRIGLAAGGRTAFMSELFSRGYLQPIDCRDARDRAAPERVAVAERT